jgi:polyisoprenoid-binding protein YceI
MLLSITGTLLLSIAGNPQAGASTWSVDMNHSEIGFVVKHMVVTNVRGKFKAATGEIVIDDAKPEATKLSISIDASSVDTDVPDRDKHLRSAEFFDTDKHKAITYQSTKVMKKGTGFEVQGNLTIRGVTKPVTLAVAEVSKPVKNPWGQMVRGVSASAEIDRKDFGLTWNKALEAGGVAVGDKVKIVLELELVQK